MSKKIDIVNSESEIAEQQGYTARVKTVLESKFDHIPLACIVTYGCQQNVSDSERIKGMLSEMGFRLTDDTDKADLILCNTCAVRGHAEDRVYGNVGELKHNKRKNPDLIIAICGCMMQQKHAAERIRKSYPYVDIVFGTHVIHRLPEFLWRRITGSPRVFELPESDGEIVEGVPVHRDGEFKGWLPIMYGCNNFCSYCIVPYVRGRERSRKPEEIISEAREMISANYKDITLLGQNVNSYGKGEQHGVNFASLLRILNELDGDFRIRFMTSHPKDCTKELIDTIRDCDKVCNHLHLPFQSGSDRVLKVMNRRYTKSDYLTLADYAYEQIPDINLTSDIIVGFPGETYADFKETLDVVERVKFLSLFTFIYSPRLGTPAAEMPDPASRKQKGEWFEELLKLQEGISKNKLQNCVGRTYRVLGEESGRRDGYITGRSDSNLVIEFKGSVNLIGKFANVRVTNLSNVLEGELINWI